jgi:tellurite resistance protein
MAGASAAASTRGAPSRLITRSTAICGLCVTSPRHVLNLRHSVKLRQMLIRTHMEELKEHTQNVLYERYRSAKLVSMGVTQDQTVFKEIKLVPGVCRASWLIGRYSPAAKMAEERAAHEMKLAKMEAEMKMVFQQKVQEKEAKLKLSEEELYARHKEMKEACVASPFPWDALETAVQVERPAVGPHVQEDAHRERPAALAGPHAEEQKGLPQKLIQVLPCLSFSAFGTLCGVPLTAASQRIMPASAISLSLLIDTPRRGSIPLPLVPVLSSFLVVRARV